MKVSLRRRVRSGQSARSTEEKGAPVDSSSTASKNVSDQLDSCDQQVPTTTLGSARAKMNGYPEGLHFKDYHYKKIYEAAKENYPADYIACHLLNPFQSFHSTAVEYITFMAAHSQHYQ